MITQKYARELESGDIVNGHTVNFILASAGMVHIYFTDGTAVDWVPWLVVSVKEVGKGKEVIPSTPSV